LFPLLVWYLGSQFSEAGWLPAGLAAVAVAIGGVVHALDLVSTTFFVLSRSSFIQGNKPGPLGHFPGEVRKHAGEFMKTFRIAVFGLFVTITSVSAGDSLATKKVLTLDGASQVITATVAAAKEKRSTAAIAVVDDGGNLVALERIDGTFAAGPNIAIGKARTAALFQHPSKVFEDIIAKGRTAMVALNDFTPLQGGVPIMVDSQIVGAVGVSGATNADEDQALAVAGASAIH
jgi:glc operon protein GlcG